MILIFKQSTIPFHKALLMPCWVIQHFIHKSVVSLDFVMTSMISCSGQNLAITSGSNVVTCLASSWNILKDSVCPYKIYEEYGDKKCNLLFSRMIKYSPSVSCDINNVKQWPYSAISCNTDVNVSTTTAPLFGGSIYLPFTKMAAWNVWKASFRQGVANPLVPCTPQCEASSIYWLFQDQA